MYTCHLQDAPGASALLRGRILAYSSRTKRIPPKRVPCVERGASLVRLKCLFVWRELSCLSRLLPTKLNVLQSQTKNRAAPTSCHRQQSPGGTAVGRVGEKQAWELLPLPCEAPCLGHRPRAPSFINERPGASVLMERRVLLLSNSFFLLIFAKCARYVGDRRITPSRQQTDVRVPLSSLE